MLLHSYFENSLLLNIINKGGPVVLILLGLSVIAVTIIILKVSHFTFLRVGSARKLDKILSHWEANQLEEAISLSQKQPRPIRTSLTGTMTALANGQPVASVREDATRLASNHLSSIRSNLRILDLISQIAPLLGLFGTVVGMIDAFHKLQAAGDQVNPATLAGGIWVALLTTAVGLAVAIPVSMALSWFDSRIERQRQVLENALSALFTGRIADPDTQAQNLKQSA